MGRPDRPSESVTVYEPDRFFRGYSLFCHTYDPPPPGQPARVLLMDMEGRVAHEWRLPFSVQLCELLPGGNLLVSTRDRSRIEEAGLREVEPSGRVAWFYHCRVDHDFHVMPGGRLTVHCLIDRMVPALGPGLRRCPYIIEIDRDGRLLWEWHGEEHVEELVELVGLEVPIDWPRRVRAYLDARAAWDERARGPRADETARQLVQTWTFDWAHNNTCEVIPPNASGERDPRFREGNILFSYRSLSIIGVIDRSSGRVVWAWGPGELDGQHKPTMLPNGHILVFDNGTGRGWSRLIELDPVSGRIVWQYAAEPKRDFFSPYISGADMLPNGNVFVCEGGPARLFEVTRQGELVWEFRSPYRVPGTYGIYRATRYSPERAAELLGRRDPPAMP